MFAITFESDHRPLAVVKFSDSFQLEGFADAHCDEGKQFREDLLDRESDGLPIWDGMAPLTYRLATKKEEAVFDCDFCEAVETGEVGDSDEDGFVSFLLPRDPEKNAYCDPYNLSRAEPLTAREWAVRNGYVQPKTKVRNRGSRRAA